MRKSTALKKNLTLEFHYWKAFVGTAEQLSMKIDDIQICIFGPRCIRIIESIFNHSFIDEEKVKFIANTFKVDNLDLYINDTFVTDLDYTRMWLVNEAFAKVTSYSIIVSNNNLRWTYSWSLDWHVQNLSSQVETVEVQPEELESKLAELKEKYLPLVTHNCYYSFEVIEYRGKDYNRTFSRDSVGFTSDNFDENIRKSIFKNN